jgi:hypothetical protein
MVSKAFWYSGLLLILLQVASAGEKSVHPQGHGPAPLNPGRGLYTAAPVPQYLILGQTTGGVATPTLGHSYAYGWFGVSPRRHTITHRGYYGGRWHFPGRIAP